MAIFTGFVFYNGKTVSLQRGVTKFCIYIRNYTQERKIYKQFNSEFVSDAQNEFLAIKLKPSYTKYLTMINGTQETKIASMKGDDPNAISPVHRTRINAPLFPPPTFHLTLSRIPFPLETSYKSFNYSEFGINQSYEKKFLTLCVMSYFFTQDIQRQRVIVEQGKKLYYKMRDMDPIID